MNGGGGTGRGAGQERLERAWRRFRTGLRARFRIDLRALAAFRMALGAIVVLNLVLRSRYLETFYTDHGVLPRSVLADVYPMARTLSLHAQLGSTWWVVLLFAIGVLAGVCLLVGYRSRIAALVSLVLVVSLHGRNPMVLNGGDILLRHLLFWAVLLPLGARWGLDSTRTERETDGVASIAAAGLLLQVVIVYLVNVVLKFQGDRWVEGVALQYVFSLDQFTVLLGDFVAELPWLLAILERGWLLLLLASSLLILLRGWPRALLAGGFMTAHVGMGLTMMLGIFPLVSIAGLVPFLPPPVWDRLEPRLTPVGDRIRTAIGGAKTPGADGVGGALPAGDRLRSLGAEVASVVAGLALIVMVLFNVGTVAPEDLDPTDPTPISAEDPRWNMFAPNPLDTDGWYLMVGTTESGREVDAFYGGNLSWDRPPDLADTFPTARWRKYLGNVMWHEEPIREGFVAYLCDRWERRHESRLDRIGLYFMAQPTRLDAPEPIDRRRATRVECP